VVTPAPVQKSTRDFEAPKDIKAPAPSWLLNNSEERKLTPVAPKRSSDCLILGLISLGGLSVLRNLIKNLLNSEPKNIKKKTLIIFPIIATANTLKIGRLKTMVPTGTVTNTSAKGTILTKNIKAY